MGVVSKTYLDSTSKPAIGWEIILLLWTKKENGKLIQKKKTISCNSYDHALMKEKEFLGQKSYGKKEEGGIYSIQTVAYYPDKSCFNI